MPYSAFPPSLPNPLQPLPAAQKVLVVDDVPDNATVICQVIKDLCGPLVAYTGEEALALAHQHQPDLILLDIRMRSEEHTSELQSQSNIVCRLLLEKKKPPESQCDHS